MNDKAFRSGSAHRDHLAVRALRQGLVVLAMLAGVAVPAGAVSEPATQRLTGAALTSAFVGKVFRGIYQDGTGWREAYLVDGEVDYEDEYRAARGDWFVEDDLLCTFYHTGLTGGCFIVMRRSENCFDFYAINPETDMPDASKQSIQAGYDWTAQGARSDRTSTCPEGLVS
ncbi:MAG: hypothetical protein RIB53_11180 [Roseitalea porphyridii]|jgi:hypothetical protein|uniref:hypothetical protein n=1 Tax=Roseitalea porphyridii TaxID=1852022 RepID=UPI0032D91078